MLLMAVLMTDKTQITLTAPASVDLALVTGLADSTLRAVERHRGERDRGAIPSSSQAIKSEAQSLTALFRLHQGCRTVRGSDPEYAFALRSSFEARKFRPMRCARTFSSRSAGEPSGRNGGPESATVDAIRPIPSRSPDLRERVQTYLAMAMAVAALKRKEVGRITLDQVYQLRRAKPGFLPGTINEKVETISARLTTHSST